MKKLLSLLLVFVLIFSLAACAKAKKVDDLEIDIEYYASLGQIYYVEYSLGDDVAKTKESLSAITNDEGESPYGEMQFGDYTVMSAIDISCCYKNGNLDSGITHIIKYGEAYGFYPGAVSVQVRDTMAKMGYDSKIRAANSGELFFLPGGSTMSVLEYKIKNTTVLFVFETDALCATVIF